MWHLGTWIPASAGMTEGGAAECCRGLGCPQISVVFPQEWGIQGVENGVVQEAP
jgi:hypothetical protein